MRTTNKEINTVPEMMQVQTTYLIRDAGLFLAIVLETGIVAGLFLAVVLETGVVAGSLLGTGS